MKSRPQLIRAGPYFEMISDNPSVSLGVVDFLLRNRHIALKEVCHRKRMDMPAYAPLEYNYLESLAETFIIPARQNHFSQRNSFNNAPVRRLLLQWKQTLRALDRTLKNRSCINNLISDKVQYSEVVSDL